MGRYLIRRVLQAIPLLLLITVSMFLLVHLMPGGPDAVFYNPRLPAAGRAALRARFGLDDPLYIQFFKWLGAMLTGNFGFSFNTNQPVSEVIGEYFPNTLELFTSALSLALIIALAAGVMAAIRHNTIIDYTLTALAYLGISLPIYLFALFGQDIFGVRLQVLPTSGMSTPGGVIATPFDGFIDNVEHLLLPMCVLAIAFIAGWSRYVRSSMLDVLKQDYMRTARAKGVTRFSLFVRHGLRNAVLPLITVVALDFGGVAGGAAITEGIFAWPGMGLLFINALSARDYPVLMAMLLLGAVFVIAFNLLADILYAVFDPRIRYS